MKKNQINLFSVLIVVLVGACQSNVEEQKTASGLERKNFQRVVNGQETDLFTLRNKSGAEVCITNYGGRIVSLLVPDRDGQLQDVVLGFDNIHEYVRSEERRVGKTGR